MTASPAAVDPCGEYGHRRRGVSNHGIHGAGSRPACEIRTPAPVYVRNSAGERAGRDAGLQRRAVARGLVVARRRSAAAGVLDSPVPGVCPSAHNRAYRSGPRNGLARAGSGGDRPMSRVRYTLGPRAGSNAPRLDTYRWTWISRDRNQKSQWCLRGCTRRASRQPSLPAVETCWRSLAEPISNSASSELDAARLRGRVRR